MFCDTRYLLYWIATKVLCFCVIWWCAVFYFNMPSGSDCAVAIPTIPVSTPEWVNEWVSEWVSEWVTHLHIGVPIKTSFQRFASPLVKNDNSIERGIKFISPDHDGRSHTSFLWQLQRSHHFNGDWVKIPYSIQTMLY